MSKINDLLPSAATIRDASTESENSALRVGGFLVSLVQALNQQLPGKVIDATDISVNAAESSVTVTFKTLEDGTASTKAVTLPVASTTTAGLMSKADKQSLLDVINTSIPALQQSITDGIPVVWADGLTLKKSQVVSHNGVLYQVTADTVTTAPSSDNPGYRPLSAPIVNEVGSSEMAVMSQKTVSENIQSIVSTISEEDRLDVEWEEGTYYNANREILVSSSWQSARLDISNYSGFVLGFNINTQGGGLAYAHLLDENENVIWSERLFSPSGGGNIKFMKEFLVTGRDKSLLLSNRSASGDGEVYKLVAYDFKPLFKNSNITKLLGNFGGWNIGGYYNKSGSLASNPTWDYLDPIDVSDYIGLKFHIKVTSIELAYISFIDNDNSVITQIQASDSVVSGEIPEGSKYLLVSNRSSRSTYEKRTDSPFVLIDYIDNNPTLMDLINVYATGTALQNKTITFLGDSITYGTGATSTTCRYSSLVAKYFNAIENNKGLAGSALCSNAYSKNDSTRFITRATAEDLNGSSLIVIFGGTNDFTYDTKPIGEYFVEGDIIANGRIGSKSLSAPSDTDSFSGALHELLQEVRTNCPNTPIMFVAPINRGRFNSTSPTSKECNVNGNYLSDFKDAIKAICNHYEIPVLEILDSRLDFSDSAIASQYSSDQLHPNNLGHQLIANAICKFIESNVLL